MYTFQNKLTALLLSLVLCFALYGQEKPRLVVGIVVDQMTPDYLERFWKDFGEDGFKKLINGGCYFPNTYYRYVPTYTGPGHASIYCGSAPSMHGIVSNDWYDRKLKKDHYCVYDIDARTIGAEGDAGKRSPVGLLGEGLADAMKISSNGQSYVASLALKDRSSILPGGHSSDLSIWWDGTSAKWISSDYYIDSIPEWLRLFQLERQAEDYLQNWVPLHPDKNGEFRAHNAFERNLFGDSEADFPYELSLLAGDNKAGLIKYTPFGNTYTLDVAGEMLENTPLGSDFIPDMIAISLSSTDYIGHLFGPYSEEVRDAYIRLDLELAELLLNLDSKLGGDYVLFLSSDHGVMPNVGYLKSLGIPARTYLASELRSEIELFLSEEFGTEGLLLSLNGEQVYLDEEAILKAKLSLEKVERSLADKLTSMEYIRLAMTSTDLKRKDFNTFPRSNIALGFYPGRSGNVIFVLEEHTIEKDFEKGASHGSPYNYDSRVPLIFYGRGIDKGRRYSEEVDILQIAPTMSGLIGISPPSGATAPSLEHLIRQK